MDARWKWGSGNCSNDLENDRKDGSKGRPYYSFPSIRYFPVFIEELIDIRGYQMKWFNGECFVISPSPFPFCFWLTFRLTFPSWYFVDCRLSNYIGGWFHLVFLGFSRTWSLFLSRFNKARMIYRLKRQVFNCCFLCDHWKHESKRFEI